MEVGRDDNADLLVKLPHQKRCLETTTVFRGSITFREPAVDNAQRISFALFHLGRKNALELIEGAQVFQVQSPRPRGFLLRGQKRQVELLIVRIEYLPVETVLIALVVDDENRVRSAANWGRFIALIG